MSETGDLTRAEPKGPRRFGPGIPADERLRPGTRLGRYEIRELLGAGGMGRVYGAFDPALGREVAVKTLGAAFGADSHSLRRLEREARVLAALDHPAIATIHGLEALEGEPCLVLEKIAGGTVADRLQAGPLPPREAVAIAVQVAEGLAEAHSKGVIHRDLKPSNVMLGTGGRVKLVDFGLAKRVATDESGELLTRFATAEGAIVGTAPYMSPEQARGEELDARTDVWAFGCLVFEMVTGTPAFRGRSTAEVFVAVLRDEPSLEPLPAALRRVVRRCLAKDRDRRPQHIGDLGLELAEIAAELSAGSLPPPEPGVVGPAGQIPAEPLHGSRRPAARRTRVVVAATALVVGGLVLWAGATVLRRDRASPSPSLTLSLELPRTVRLGDGFAPPYAISPDGGRVVLVGLEGEESRLFLRRFDRSEIAPVAAGDGAWQPCFSPDGSRLAFFVGRHLVEATPEDPTPVFLAEIGTNPRGATWLPDGSIVVAPTQTSGLVRVPAGGVGRPAALTELDAAAAEHSHRWPEALPGGRWVLLTVGFEGRSYDEARIDAVAPATGERRPVQQGGSFARYADGRLVFVRGGRIHSAPFDPERAEVTGAPEALPGGVRYDPQNGAAHLAAAAGALVYTPAGPTSSETRVAWFEPGGRVERWSETPRAFREPRLSPDGGRVAMIVGTGSDSDLRVLDSDGSLTQVSFGLSPHRPAWTPDGRRIVVAAEQEGAWRLLSLAADRSGTPAVLWESPNRVLPGAWSPDGRRLVFQERTLEAGWELRVLEVGADGRATGFPQPVASTPFHETNAVISPDGRWIAYESDQVDGLVQVWVGTLEEGGAKVSASPAGARWPVWGPGGRLYYWDTGSRRIERVVVAEAVGRPSVEAPLPVLPDGTAGSAVGGLVVDVTGARFDVHPEDGRILALQAATSGEVPALTLPVVALGWHRTATDR